MKAKKHAESAQNKTQRKHKSQDTLEIGPESVKMQLQKVMICPAKRSALEARTLDIAAVRYV